MRSGGDGLALILVVADAVSIRVGDRDVPGAAPDGRLGRFGLGRQRRAAEVVGERSPEAPSEALVALAIVRFDELAVTEVGPQAESRDVREIELDPAADLEPERPGVGRRGGPQLQVEEDATPGRVVRLPARAEAQKQGVVWPRQPPLV